MAIRHPLPVVSQLRARNPDGSIDPAAYTDCGESCLSSLLIAAGRIRLSPGCIRQSLGLPELVGSSTGMELAEWLGRVGLRAALEGSMGGDKLRTHIESAERTEGACIILGDWNGPDLAHWNLTGRVSNEGAWCMDPALGRVVRRTWADLARLYLGQLVAVHVE